jgi:hypothetical protein
LFAEGREAEVQLGWNCQAARRGSHPSRAFGLNFAVCQDLVYELAINREFQSHEKYTIDSSFDRVLNGGLEYSTLAPYFDDSAKLSLDLICSTFVCDRCSVCNNLDDLLDGH